ncbi:hypothetical protein Lbir_2936 [Legionella birminghamensis]|uniref:Uncharacterized protein n=1 Tax=Legionella birminghamensis TaxID=28083 RepID=A0A378I7E7_9GAMM|nr:hypothetical protein Lbir_2936 [Legionella birminghamensis]STX30953.1 Uncharacterised protein [Legionella birminghamensis]
MDIRCQVLIVVIIPTVSGGVEVMKAISIDIYTSALAIESPRHRPRGPHEANLMLSTLVYDYLLNLIFWQH